MSQPMPKPFLPKLRWLVSLLLRCYLLMLAPLTYFQRSLIYHPHRSSRLKASDAGLPQFTVDLTVRAQDGVDLHGWLALAGTSPASPDVDAKQVLRQGGPVILFYPGNAGNRSMRKAQLTALGSLAAHVVIVDYRGYGDNSGHPSEANFTRDARSVWDHLTQEWGVAPGRIVIYGESLGGGVATRLASDLCLAGIQPGGLVVQSSFSSLVAAGQAHFWFVPVSLLLVDRFPSDERISNVACPILQIHGQADSIVPFEIGQKLFEAAPAMSSTGIAKRMAVMPHTDHNDVYFNQADRRILASALEEFLVDVNRQLSSADDDMPATPKTSNDKPNIVEQKPVTIDWTIFISLTIVTIVVLLWWFERTRSKP